jgi:hypothetical protein
MRESFRPKYASTRPCRSAGTFRKAQYFDIFNVKLGANNDKSYIPPLDGGYIAKLKNMAQREPCANVAAQLGRSVGATAVKAHQLGLSLKVPRPRRSRCRRGGYRVMGQAPGGLKAMNSKGPPTLRDWPTNVRRMR